MKLVSGFLTTFVACLSLPFVELQSSDKWWLTETSNPIVCCECVPFFACVNNTIDRSKLLENNKPEPLVNLQFCPNPTEFCCLAPEAKPECQNFPLGRMPKKVNTEPHPHTHCECSPWETCPLEKIVTDGKGDFNPLLKKIGLVTHSKCKEPLDVCCHQKPVVMTAMEARMKGCRCVSKENCASMYNYGEGVLEPRNRAQKNDSCQHEDEICCPLKDITEETSGNAHPIFNMLYICPLIILMLVFQL